jgi:glycosyltransferase involved in cell wall biosynthesis
VEPGADQLGILWCSPLPPTRSGVADYAVELLPELARLARVRVVRPPGWTEPASWPADLELAPTDAAPSSGEVELLHLGNNPHHLWLLPRLERGGAVVELHDAVLHHLLVEATAARGDVDEYERRLTAAHGPRAAALAAARRAGHHGRLDPFLLPARRAILDRAAGLVVHSEWALATVRRELPEIPATRVDLAVADPGPVDRAAARTRIGVPAERTLLMHLGFLTPEKGLEAIAAGVGAACKAGLDVGLAVVGEGRSGDDLAAAARRVGCGDRVVATGWVEPEVLAGLPAAADLGVVLRSPSAGETSAAALRFFACGVPVAVGGRRQFLEWPEAAAPRLTGGPAAAADLARLLAAVGGDGWAARGREARALYLRRHRPELVAGQLVEALRSLAGASGGGRAAAGISWPAPP